MPWVELLWPDVGVAAVAVTVAVVLAMLVAKLVRGALFQGLVAAVPLTFLGLILCAYSAHSTLPLVYVGLPFIPTALLIRVVTGRDIGDHAMYRVFWFLQGVYYVLVFSVLGRFATMRHRAEHLCTERR